MSLAHFGVAVFVLGVTVASAFSIERDISLQPGDSQEIAGYTFTFRSVSDVPGPNYEAIEAVVDISRDGKPNSSFFTASGSRSYLCMAVAQA